jgi:hypothetical protein
LTPPEVTPRYGFTVADLAKRYRVSPDKVRAWIKRGELPAVNTASAVCRKPRFVVLPDAVAAFEQRRGVAPPTPKPQRRRRRPEFIDFYAD